MDITWTINPEFDIGVTKILNEKITTYLIMISIRIKVDLQ